MTDKATPINSLGNYNRSQISVCEDVAKKQQHADRSDPFTYNRVMSHLLTGLCLISDYEVEFRNEPRMTENGKSYSVQVPCNQKRP